MKFTPTPAMISIAETLFAAMAMVELIRPVVTGYQTDILKRGQWPVRPEYADRLGAEVIVDPKLAYLMSEDDFAMYDTQCKAARKAADLHVNDDRNCPLLVAEHLVIEAEAALIDAMAPLTNLTAEKLNTASLDKRKKAVDLTLKLMAPFVGDSKTIISHLRAPTA